MAGATHVIDLGEVEAHRPALARREAQVVLGTRSRPLAQSLLAEDDGERKGEVTLRRITNEDGLRAPVSRGFPGLGLVVLLVIQILNVYQPQGMTPYGLRKQRRVE